MSRCELCGGEAFNEHHLIPRHCHRKSWFKNRFSKELMQQTIDVCKMCHQMIHHLVPDEKELGRSYNTIELLAAHPEIRNYLKWKKKRVRN
ncbi:hypothetical protein ACYFX5_13575 [Bremerella sp. T1]|uniref:hypothetical protein n=1 Tax=Bremerella sp. TYQ1 TaxID=3119568 RepID=UPI001CCD54D2|nr:hypothetical protein [Bremerella volcania]UBM34089.1 hypothetical protein LA756_15515 [Bremerella volcania]